VRLVEPLPPPVIRVVRWVTLASLVVFLLVATSGRPWELFARGPFTADFFEAQARSLLHGHLDVPADTAGIEGFRIGDKTYLYYGLVPALLRLPVVAVTQALDGRLVTLSRLVALAIALRATAGLAWQARERFVARPAGRRDVVVVGGLVAAAGLTSPLLFLAARPVVYHEVELWGTAFALVAFDRVLAWWRAPTTAALVVASGAATLALSTRASVGLGPIVALGLVAAERVLRQRWREAGPILLAAAVPVALYGLVNHARFGSWFSVPFDKQVFSTFGTDRQAALAFTGNSLFSLRYLPTAALHYLRPDAIGLQRLFPWVGFGPRAHVIGNVTYDTVDRSSSITALSPLLCVVAAVGLVHLLRHRRGASIWWYALAGSAVGVIVTWTIGFIANRYLSDLVPTLVLAAAPGAWALAAWGAGLGVTARRLAVAAAVALGAWGLLASSAQALLTANLFLVPDPQGQRGFIGFQHDLDHRLFGGRPYRLSLTDTPPADPHTGDLVISGDCAGLYWFDGASWIPLERRPGGGRSILTSGALPQTPFLLAQGDGWVIDVEVLDDGSRRFLYRAEGRPDVAGPAVDLPPGADLALELVVDPMTTEVRVTDTRDGRQLVNAFLVPAGGPITLDPAFVSVEAPGPAPQLCARLLDRAASDRGGR
jgi:hypothetical protein